MTLNEFPTFVAALATGLLGDYSNGNAPSIYQAVENSRKTCSRVHGSAKWKLVPLVPRCHRNVYAVAVAVNRRN